MKKLLIALIALCFFITCSTSKKQEAIKPDVPKFFQVYQTFIQLNANDSTGMTDKSVLMDSALALHGMDAAQFDTTLSYLEKNPDIFLQAFEMFDDSMRIALNIGVSD